MGKKLKLITESVFEKKLILNNAKFLYNNCRVKQIKKIKILFKKLNISIN